MKISIQDEVVNRLHKMRLLVDQKLKEQYKGVNPYRKEPIPKNELKQVYDSLTPEEMDDLVSQHGRNNINEFIRKMETGG